MTGGDLRAALSLALIGAGMLFFLAGSIGVLRLPDLLSRLHALTKADNLGLGLVVLGLMLQADSGCVWGGCLTALHLHPDGAHERVEVPCAQAQRPGVQG